MMTQAAQAALRRVIEQYTKNVRFCIICNYVNKIAPAIQSRCTRFRFSPLPIPEVQKRVDSVVEAEKWVSTRVASYTGLRLAPSIRASLTADGKSALLKLSRGDMRRALNVLQACHAAYDIIGETEIYNCTGNPHPSDIETIVNSMLSDEFTASYQSRYLFCPLLSLSSNNIGLSSDFKNENRARHGASRPSHWSLWLYWHAWAQATRKNIPLRSSCFDRVRPGSSWLVTSNWQQLMYFHTVFRHRLSTGGDERIQLAALLAAFKTAVDLSAKN